MKDVETYIGELINIKRARSSKNGNPRWMVRIEGAPICYTAPDDMLGYEVKNFKPGQRVSARIGWHYGTVTLSELSSD